MSFVDSVARLFVRIGIIPSTDSNLKGARPVLEVIQEAADSYVARGNTYNDFIAEIARQPGAPASVRGQIYTLLGRSASIDNIPLTPDLIEPAIDGVVDEFVTAGVEALGGVPKTPSPSLIPENISPDAGVAAHMVRVFIEEKVRPHLVAIETGRDTDHQLIKAIFREAGREEVGIFGSIVPEEDGGSNVALDVWAAMTAAFVRAGSLAAALLNHMGLGMYPLICFGSAKLKEKYLPKMMSGELTTAYGLTEPGSGSDAFAMKTSAALSDDGTHYILNGSKCFITNAGFADLFTVFARVMNKDGTPQFNKRGEPKIAAFIVERNAEGFVVGPEYEKLGLDGSSTCPLYFSDTPVPAENLIGKDDEGRKIAMTALNTGRLRIGIGCGASALYLMELAVDYARGREQFGAPIAEFGAVQADIARAYAQGFAAESLGYAIAGRIGNLVANGTSKAEAFKDFAPHAAMTKVISSRAGSLASKVYATTMGGPGYMDDPGVSDRPARYFRDALGPEIFEGTNHINTLQVAQGIARSFDLVEKKPLVVNNSHALEDAVRQSNLAQELVSYLFAFLAPDGDRLMPNKAVAGYGQHAPLHVAELIMSAHAIHATAQRAIQLAASNPDPTSLPTLAARIFIHDEFRRMLTVADELVESFYADQPDKVEEAKQNIRGLAHFPPLDMKVLHQQLVEKIPARQAA